MEADPSGAEAALSGEISLVLGTLNRNLTRFKWKYRSILIAQQSQDGLAIVGQFGIANPFDLTE